MRVCVYIYVYVYIYTYSMRGAWFRNHKNVMMLTDGTPVLDVG